MLKELYGFDIRVDPEDYCRLLRENPKRYRYEYSDQKRREADLLRPEVEFPLTVTCVWPRVFPIFGFFPDADEDLDLRREFWLDLEELRTYFLERKDAIQCKGVLMAAVWCRAEKTDPDRLLAKDGILGLSMDQIPDDWVFMGYDMANEDVCMGLHGYGIGKMYRKEWASCINDNGLFREFKDALAFTDVAFKDDPSEGLFYVFALYRDPNTI